MLFHGSKSGGVLVGAVVGCAIAADIDELCMDHGVVMFVFLVGIDELFIGL